MKKEEISTNSLAHTKCNCKYHIVLSLSTIINKFFKIKLPYHKVCALWYGKKYV